MKTKTKTIFALAATAALTLSLAAATPDDTKENWRVVKNAVRSETRSEQVREGREGRFLKILITEGRRERETLRLSLPLSLVEAVLRLASDDHHYRFDDRDRGIDFLEVFAALKKGGPQALLEIRDHDELIKIWIE
jgi:hypothetical protein